MAKKPKKQTPQNEQANVYKPEVPTLCHVGTSTRHTHFTEDGEETLCGRPQTVEANGRSLVFLKEPRGTGKNCILYPDCRPATCLDCEGERTGLPKSVMRKKAKTAKTTAIQKKAASKKAAARRVVDRAVPATYEEAQDLSREITGLKSNGKEIELAVARASGKERNGLIDRMAFNLDIRRPTARTRAETVAWIMGRRTLLPATEFKHAISDDVFKEKKAARAILDTPDEQLAAEATTVPGKKRPAVAKKPAAASAPITTMQVIAAIAKNPKRPGSASHARFALYKKGMTVNKALAAGVTKGDIKWDAERGFITLKAK